MSGDVLERILAHAVDSPSRPAAKDDVRELDYGGLQAEVGALAAGLSARGVGPGARIALDFPNSVDFLVASLACLWVGAMFIPLAVTDPAARVEAIVDDCGPAMVLTNPARAELHSLSVEVSTVALSTLRPPPPVEPGNLAAYAIYTSGTTGTPKGVVIGRSAFATAVAHTVDALGMDPDTHALCVSPFHFDGSFGTLFPALVAGGSLLIPPRESLLFPRFFFRTVAREGITHTGFSSSYLKLLLAAPQLDTLGQSNLQVIALGGEACSALDVDLLWKTKPDIRVFNRYGPTETTIAVTHFELTPEVLDRGGAVPMGVPHPGTDFYLIDKDGSVIEASGTAGELFIGGAQLMAGYWGAEELTAEVLRTDVVAGQRTYRSGDLVHRDTYGNYVYVDRADRVVKRNAVRISLVELGEVLRAMPGITAATCATYDLRGALGIAAFVVSPTAQSSVELRRAAAERLPQNMLPDTFVLVDSLPLTSSSKVDERRLLADAGLQPPVAV